MEGHWLVTGASNVSLTALSHWLGYIYSKFLGRKVKDYLGCMKGAGKGTK